MKKRLSLTKRMMLTTSLLLTGISVLFAVFSVFNAYFNLLEPSKELYAEQPAGDFILDASRFMAANLIFLAVSILTGCALTYLAAKFSLKPLKNWSEELADIDQYQLSKRIQKLNTGDELDTLANSFNQLLDRLEKAFEREKRFSAAVAHELKTPLTVVKSNIEFLQLEENPEAEEYAETIEIVQKQNERMVSLVRDLSLLSSTHVQQQKDWMDLDGMLGEIEGDLKPPLQDKNIQFSYNRAGFWMEGNAVLMKHALSNLIENAIKYNVDGGEILVCQSVEEHQYTISVSDTGIGINPEDAPYIFEPFYRADKSRSRATGGAGLGLAITKEIIEEHNGSIRYEAREPRGSVFTISISI